MRMCSPHVCCRSSTAVTPATALTRIDEVCAACVVRAVAVPFNVAAAHFLSMRYLSVCAQTQELRSEMRQELQQMRALLAQKGMVVGESATTLGMRVLDAATREQLVTVTEEARHAAEDLLLRAGQVGEAVRRATRLESQLTEAGDGGVQQLVSKLLQSSQPPGPLYVQDVHTTASVCGRLRPDLVVTLGPQLLPSSTVLVVDLKRQDGAYNSPAHIHQVSRVEAQYLCILAASDISHFT